ncbi:MAG: ankyrin repeat domain-containing protein, partial [Dongiaceae bacterium]
GAPLAQGGMALRRAAARGFFRIVKLLVEAGVDRGNPPDFQPDAQDDGSKGKPRKPRTPYEDAVAAGHTFVADYLAGKHMDEATERAALDAEARLKSPAEELMETARSWAEEAGVKLDDPPLQGEDRRQAVTRVVALIRAGSIPGGFDTAGPMRQPAIITAAEDGDLEIVQALLDAGARADVPGEKRTTALIEAVRYGRRPIVELLLRSGANPNAANEEGWTPLMRAAERGDLEVVRLLLNAGADPKAKMRGGKTARHFACGLHQPAIERLLQERGGPSKPRAAAQNHD